VGAKYYCVTPAKYLLSLTPESRKVSSSAKVCCCTQLIQQDNQVLMVCREIVDKELRKERPSIDNQRLLSRRVDGDDFVLNKAQRLALKRNLGNCELSFTPIKSKQIFFNMQNIAVRLGKDANELLKYVATIKNIEVDRLNISAKLPITKKIVPCEDDNDNIEDMM
jgi:hypothetical protein